MDDRGAHGEAGARPRPGGIGRAAKLVAPRDPNGTLDRPELEARLAAGADRRLTVIVAGAGFGKSTLASRTARSRSAAWYTVDASDAHLGTFASGVVAALRRLVPQLAEDLATPIASAVDPADEADAQHRGQAAATLVADALQDVLVDDVLLVLDDCQEIDGATGSWRFVEALVRFAPANLHLLLVSRNDPPFGVERLRAQGEVSDLGGSSLAFTVAEIETLVTSLLPDDAVPRDATPDAAARIFTATDGWPAAVRLTIEALRAAPQGGREAVLDRLQRPEGPLFAYLAEEVVARATEPIRHALARAVHFERFSGPLLEAVGIDDATAVLDGLARRGLFLQPLPGRSRLVRAPRADPRVRQDAPGARRRGDAGPAPPRGRLARGARPARRRARPARRGRRPGGARRLPGPPRADARARGGDAPGHRGRRDAPRRPPHAARRARLRGGLHGPRRLARGARRRSPARPAARTGSTPRPPGASGSCTACAARTTRRSRSTPGPS